MTSNVVERSPELWCMEELTRRCDRLSLSAREDTRITLSKKQVTSDCGGNKVLYEESFEYGGGDAYVPSFMVHEGRF